jgi:hypothetical protein
MNLITSLYYIIRILKLLNPSGRTMALGSTKPLAEMSTMDISWGQMRPVRMVDNLTTLMCRLSWNSGSLNLLESQGPAQACDGIAFV